MRYRKLSSPLPILGLACFANLAGALAQTTSPQLGHPVAATAPTAVPALVSYSGVAIGAEGKALAAESAITFLIYNDAQGGEPLFTETQRVAVDPTGRYKVQLGSTFANGIPLDLFSTGEARWLEVQIAGQSPQARVLLASVPYALKAADSATLGGLPASAFALAGSKGVANAAPAVLNPEGVLTVTTTGGTSGYVPAFSSASTIVNSPVFVSGANVGIGTAAPTATLDVAGTALIENGLTVGTAATMNAPVTLSPTGTATASKHYPSQYIKFVTSGYNSSSNSVVQPRFQLEAEAQANNTANPYGTLNLLASTPTSAPVETGFYFNYNGTINFAPGQTFPGAGTLTGVTAGTGLTGGGTTGNVTLNVDTTKVPLLAANNTFTGNQTVTGSETVSGRITGSSSLFLPNTTSATVGLVELGTTPFLSNYPSGSDNAIVGGAGNFTMTGTLNTATGFDALHANTSGVANTADGTYSLISETSATANTAIGYDSVYRTTSGSENAGLGYGALFYNTTGSENTAVGTSAGPDSSSTALLNSTALGANAIVSQSNSLILGQTTAGNPGNTFVNVGIGTATPASALEASVNVASGLGPTLTLTNPGGSGGSPTNQGTATSIDFNSYLGSSESYGPLPEARIESVDNGFASDDLIFYSKYPGGGAINSFLQQNLTIQANGQVAVGVPTSGTLPSLSAQLTVFDIGPDGWDGIDTYGSAEIGAGITATGGDETASSDTQGGTGGNFYGGYGPGITGDGIYATPGNAEFSNGPGYAAYLDGNVDVTGALTVSGTKHFKIDDPLDPANKYLVHSSVESSEMMNIYSGNVTTDDLGVATVTLPVWFQAENGDFRYQLTVLGGRFAQAIVSKEIDGNQFTISTNATNVKVSWQVTAVRQDAYAKAHPMVVEQVKPAAERGFYEHPELFGQPKEKQTEWGRHPQAMLRTKAMQEQRKLALANGAKAAKLEPKSDIPASAVNRNFVHPAGPPIQLPTSGPQLKPISQIAGR